MVDQKIRRTREEVLDEVGPVHQHRLSQASVLLDNIKKKRAKIEGILELFKREEPDLVYRFYHQSFKVFIMVDIIRQAVNLINDLAPNSTKINDWYGLIAAEAQTKEFGDETNSRWLAETMPVLQGFWHSKYFLEQMLVAADELDTAPEILPSGWAAVLYLYDLR